MKTKMDAQFIDSIPAAFREGDGNADTKLEEAENVRLVEKVYRIIASDDFTALDDVLADDAVLEIIGPPGVPFVGSYRGRDQVIETTRRNFSQVEAQRPSILSVVAQGDTVVVLGKEHGRFRPTGQEYELHWMHQLTFRHGKLTHVRELFDSASTLKVTVQTLGTESQTLKESHMSEENKALIQRWFEEVWNKGYAEAIDEMFADDGVAHGLVDDGGNTIRGTVGFKAFHQTFRNAFPDLTVTVVDTVAEGDKVAARCAVSGTHGGADLGFAATNKPIQFEGILIARIENGKIIESWNQFDFLSLYRQLGAVSGSHI